MGRKESAREGEADEQNDGRKRSKGFSDLKLHHTFLFSVTYDYDDGIVMMIIITIIIIGRERKRPADSPLLLSFLWHVTASGKFLYFFTSNCGRERNTQEKDVCEDNGKKLQRAYKWIREQVNDDRTQNQWWWWRSYLKSFLFVGRQELQTHTHTLSTDGVKHLYHFRSDRRNRGDDKTRVIITVTSKEITHQV